jgi:hypothetical protein
MIMMWAIYRYVNRYLTEPHCGLDCKVEPLHSNREPAVQGAAPPLRSLLTLDLPRSSSTSSLHLFRLTLPLRHVGG